MNPYLPYAPGDAVWHCVSHVERGVTVVNRYPATVVRVEGHRALLDCGARTVWTTPQHVQPREVRDVDAA